MLDEARRRRERGQDVVVGAVQPQLPPEAEVLLAKLEVIALKELGDGTAVDVEALLRRRPDACFIDGLAYDNPPGSRNATRWQDAKELVQAGVKVIASINIQYIAELREQVQAITGKRVTQTVPISFIKSADEIEIVDAPPVEPLGRSPAELTSVEKQQERLSRLREMALVLAADVVDRQLGSRLESEGIQQRFGVQERILVWITPKCNAQEMIERAQVVAQRFHGQLTAAYVDEPGMSAADRASLDRNLQVVCTAGAHIEILDGEPVDAIVEFARARGITQIFVGHSQNSGPWSAIWRTSVDKLIQKSKGMDVRIFPNKR
jgi:two-component system sensor histidine kinase KdpD